MISIDTSVLVGFVTNDEPRQAKRARALIESTDILVTTTVLLESEWVLRAGYGFSAEEILRAFRTLLGIPGVQAESPERVASAFQGLEGGLDFADALHLACGETARQFATFDDKLVRRRKRMPGIAAVPV